MGSKTIPDKELEMPGYAVAQLWNVNTDAEIVEYLERIDATLTPFGGRFLVHGGPQRVIEGPADAVVIIIEFPDYRAVNEWYDSAAYQETLPLRLRNCASVGALATDCGDDHVATDVLREVVPSE